MVSHSEAVQKQVNSCVTKSTELNREKDDDYAFIRQYKRDSDKKKLHERHKTVIVQSISYKVPDLRSYISTIYTLLRTSISVAYAPYQKYIEVVSLLILNF